MDKFTKLVTEIGKLWSKYGNSYLTGIQNTLILALAATAIGCIIGFACGILNTIPCSKNDPLPKRILLKLVRIIVRVYVEVFRGTPMVLQAVFIYYGLPYFTDNALKFTNMWVAALVVVSVNTGAYMAEIVRGGIISIDKGQFEGAQALGMSHLQIMCHIVLPQVIRNILPSVSNEFIINIKDTSVLNVIGVTELYFYAGKIKLFNLQIFQTYFVVCVLYFILTFSISRLLRLAERKLDGKENYTICGSQSDFNAEIHVQEESPSCR